VSIDDEPEIAPFGFENVAIAVVVATGVDGAAQGDFALAGLGVVGCARDRPGERPLAITGAIEPYNAATHGGLTVGDWAVDVVAVRAAYAPGSDVAIGAGSTE